MVKKIYYISSVKLNKSGYKMADAKKHLATWGVVRKLI